MQFENRAVAFIDILGFKAIVDKAVHSNQAKTQLINLVKLLESAVPILDGGVDQSIPKHLIPRHQYISDCIILSAPLFDSDVSGYNGFEIIVMRAIQLSHFFLNEGYLIRGGISVGELWHTDTNIIGPAYQQAYQLEANGSKPFIQIHENALNHWNGGSRMCLNDGEIPFVNGLFEFYMPNSKVFGGIESTYNKYENIISENLLSGLPDGANAKWLWYQKFLLSEKPEGLKWAVAER
jgi:hypothetical protein